MSNVSGMPAIDKTLFNGDLEDRSKCVRKWGPIMENMGIYNETVKLYLCLFAEYRANQINEMQSKMLSTINPTIEGNGDKFPNTLPEELRDMVEKLVNKLGRIKLKGQCAYYNIIKNTIEYELENGEFVSSQKLGGGNYNNTIVDSDVLSEFSIDFQHAINPVLARDYKLKKIK